MKRGCGALIISIVLTLLPCSCILPDASDTWTVASWNVQNLFDGIDNGSEYYEFDPGNGEWTDDLYRIRLENTAEILLSLCSGGPDLVLLQEIENQGVLDDLATGPLSGKGYRWRFSAPGEDAVRCGVLSRYPVSEVRAAECGFWGERPLRPILSFQVHLSAMSIQVLSVHWKSPWNGRAATETARRTEAAVAANIIRDSLRNNPDAPLMLIGDLNTPGDGAVVPAALAPRHAGCEAVIFGSAQPGGSGITGNGELVLYDPEPDSMQGAIGSYWYRGSWDRPDRALLSPGLVNGSGYRFRSLVCADGLNTSSEGHPLRWITDFRSGYSDHLPILLSFEAGKSQ